MHLKQTLPQNIRDNLVYRNLEIVLLDYNSQDDMQAWVMAELGEHLQSGLLRYYKAPEPAYFNISHAKNMAFRLATGDILCSVDADNYTGNGFAHYVNSMFSQRSAIYLCPPRIGPRKEWWDVQGRLCIRNSDFYNARGYDETFLHYGYEDQDLKGRLRAMGIRKVSITAGHYLRAIAHPDHFRIRSGHAWQCLHEMLVWQKCTHTAEVISLQKEQGYEKYHISAAAGFAACADDLAGLKVTRLQAGQYEKKDGAIILYRPSGTRLLQLKATTATVYTAGEMIFNQLAEGDFQDMVLLHKAIHEGHKKLQENRKGAHLINPGGFGQGKVYRLEV